MTAVIAAPSAYTLCLAVFLYVFRHSLPFAWTFRVFSAAYRVRLTQLLRSKAVAKPVGCSGPPAVSANAASLPLSAEGCDPFSDVITWYHRATIDECDFNGHLSNSSYPRHLDVARIYYSANRLGNFMADGGWTALASTSFTFHNEIPARARYRVEMRIETWTDKWLYLRSEFRGRTKRGGDDVLFCTAITKHCFKYGRKTIAPWFVMAYCGYGVGGGENTHADTSRALRATLRSGKNKAKTPLQAYAKPGTQSADDSVAGYWQQQSWRDVSGWESERQARLQALRQSFIEGEA